MIKWFKSSTFPFLLGGFLGLIISGILIYLYFVCNSVADAGSKALGMVGGTSALVAAIAYFCRTYTEYRRDILVEKHKVIFAGAYQARADAIKEVNDLLIDFMEAIETYSTTGKPGTDSSNAAANGVNAAKNAYLNFKLRKNFYLPTDTLKVVQETYLHLHDWHMRFVRLSLVEQGTERNEAIKQFVDMKWKLPERLDVLGKAFRDVLGTDK